MLKSILIGAATAVAWVAVPAAICVGGVLVVGSLLEKPKKA